MKYLRVWADYLSSGIWDEYEGMLEPEDIGLDESLSKWLRDWVSRYEAITPLDDEARKVKADLIDALDREGIRIVHAIQDAFEGRERVKVSYFSEGRLKALYIPTDGQTLAGG